MADKQDVVVGYLDAKYEISPSKLSLERLPQEILSLKGREFNLFQITPTGTLKRVERMEMVCFLLVQAQNSRLKLLWKLPLIFPVFGTVIILGFLLCFQSFDLNNESPLNLLEEHWLGRERRELCVWSSWSWSCINSVYLQLDIRSEFFSFLFLQFIRQAEENFWKPAKILTKGFWSFAILGGCLAIASFVLHSLDLVPWHLVWQTACIALLWDRGGESFCLFLNSYWFFPLYDQFLTWICHPSPKHSKE